MVHWTGPAVAGSSVCNAVFQQFAVQVDARHGTYSVRRNVPHEPETQRYIVELKCYDLRLSSLCRSARPLAMAIDPWRNSNICDCCSLGRCKDACASGRATQPRKCQVTPNDSIHGVLRPGVVTSLRAVFLTRPGRLTQSLHICLKHCAQPLTHVCSTRARVMRKLTWLVLGGDPAARSHRVEQFTAL